MADRERSAWSTVPGTSLEVRPTVEDEHGVPALVVAVRGSLAPDARSQAVARALGEAVSAASAAAPEPEVAVLDTTAASGFAGLGKHVDALPRGLAGRLWRWAPDPGDWSAITSWFGAARVAASVRAALDELAAARRAGQLEERGQQGELVHRTSFCERGMLETVPDDEGHEVSSLWYRTRLVERSERTRAGDLVWRAEWPFPDGGGQENLASELGARVLERDGAVRELDLSPAQTGRPLAPGWLARLGAQPALEELRLSGTGAGDTEVLAALARFPGLQVLWLDHTRVTDALADALAGGLAPQLEELRLDDTLVSATARARLEQARPGLNVL